MAQQASVSGSADVSVKDFDLYGCFMMKLIKQRLNSNAPGAAHVSIWYLLLHDDKSQTFINNMSDSVSQSQPQINWSKWVSFI